MLKSDYYGSRCFIMTATNLFLFNAQNVHRGSTIVLIDSLSHCFNLVNRVILLTFWKMFVPIAIHNILKQQCADNGMAFKLSAFTEEHRYIA